MKESKKHLHRCAQESLLQLNSIINSYHKLVTTLLQEIVFMRINCVFMSAANFVPSIFFYIRICIIRKRRNVNGETPFVFPFFFKVQQKRL